MQLALSIIGAVGPEYNWCSRPWVLLVQSSPSIIGAVSLISYDWLNPVTVHRWLLTTCKLSTCCFFLNFVKCPGCTFCDRITLSYAFVIIIVVTITWLMLVTVLVLCYWWVGLLCGTCGSEDQVCLRLHTRVSVPHLSCTRVWILSTRGNGNRLHCFLVLWILSTRGSGNRLHCFLVAVLLTFTLRCDLCQLPVSGCVLLYSGIETNDYSYRANGTLS